MKLTVYPYSQELYGPEGFTLSDGDSLSLDVEWVKRWGLLRHGQDGRYWLLAQDCTGKTYVVRRADNSNPKVQEILRFRAQTIDPPEGLSGDWEVNWDDTNPRLWSHRGFYWLGSRCLYGIEKTHSSNRNERFAVRRAEDGATLASFATAGEAREYIQDAISFGYTSA